MRVLASWLGLVVTVSCARLPGVPAGECGNGVIEPPEDCDSFGVEGGAECRPKGAVGQCHFDCAAGGDGTRPNCPSGWGCDQGGICRKPTGQFAALREYEIGSAASLLSGDFDGDGRDDIASLENPDRIGATHVRFHYFDDRAELRETREFAPSLLAPTVSRLSADALSDVVFSDFRIGVLLGRSDRSWVPETFSSYRIEDTSIRTIGVFAAGAVQGSSGFVVLAVFDGVSGLYVGDAQNNGLPRLLAPLGGPNEAFAGDPVQGRLFEDTAASPCTQVVVALRGDTRFSVLDVCARSPENGEPVWRSTDGINVELTPAEGVDAAPQLVDLDADGHLDVLIGAGGRAFAAYGDGAAIAAAVPYQLPLPAASRLGREIRMPLAAGDFTADGGLDFVFDDQVLVSAATPEVGRYEYVEWATLPAGYWNAAAIGDFNANGHLDWVASSRQRTGIHFFNGTSTDNLNEFRIPTQRPVQQLALGDFDGDLINDLAFSQLDAEGAVATSAWIAFGLPAGPPAAPTQIARVGAIDQVTSFRQLARDYLMLSSSEDVDGQQQGALALFFGGGDRVPVALYELSTFAADGSTANSVALRALGGHFSGNSPMDVLAIAIDASVPLSNELEFWLLPGLAVSAGFPERLGRLPAGLRAVSGRAATARVHLGTAVLDVDGDGRDELALVAPTEDDEHCALAWVAVEGGRVREGTNLVFDEPCTAVELRALDADADGAIDLALINGRDRFVGARLSVWWNDGAGGFDTGRRSIVADRETSPRSFAALSATPAQNLTLAYATETELRFGTLSAAGRDFVELSPPLPIDRCTGMAAADLNGDGALDLTLARSGNLSVLAALLENL